MKTHCFKLRMRLTLLMSVAAVLFLVFPTLRPSASIGTPQGKGGEIKPKPSATPKTGQPTKVPPKRNRIPSPIPVRTATVAEQTFAETLNASGMVSNPEAVTVSAKISGTLKKINVKEGDAVTHWDVVAEFDDSVFRTNEEQARKALNQAQAAAASLPAGSKERSAAESRAQERGYEVNNAVMLLVDCRIQTPVDGVVRNVRVAQGQTVAVGTAVMDIAPDQLLVHVNTSQIIARDVQSKDIMIQAGKSARVIDDQASYLARVENVTTAPGNPKRITSVDISLPKNKTLHAGDRVRVEIDMDPTTVVTVPKEAVVKSGRASKMLIVVNGKAIERVVTTGATGPGWIEIRSGVKLGQSIVVDPKNLQSGQSVIVSN